MKKISIILFTVFLNFALFSCTPQALDESTSTEQGCCGNIEELPPPPPTGN